MDDRFSYANLAAGGDRVRFAAELAAQLTLRLRSAANPERESMALINELRSLGHDLWSFDESTDFQLWCGDYVNRRQRWELIIQLNYVEDVPPSASVDVREYPEIPR
jgi:hypothetical protein